MDRFQVKFCPFCGQAVVQTRSVDFCGFCHVTFIIDLKRAECPKCKQMITLQKDFCPERCPHCEAIVCPRCFSETEEELRSCLMLHKCTKCEWHCCGQCV